MHASSHRESKCGIKLPDSTHSGTGHLATCTLRENTVNYRAQLLKILVKRNPKAREWLDARIWPDGLICPRCGAVDQFTLMHGKSRRPSLYQCNACREPRLNDIRRKRQMDGIAKAKGREVRP